jgi:hypothetical protein
VEREATATRADLEVDDGDGKGDEWGRAGFLGTVDTHGPTRGAL